MAKKVKKVETSPVTTMSAIENALVNVGLETVTIHTNLNGVEYDIPMKTVITEMEKDALMKQIESTCFNDGVYNPLGLDYIEFVIFQLLTGLRLNDDINAFSVVKTTEFYRHEIVTLPAYGSIMEEIYSYIELLNAKYSIPVELSRALNRFNDVTQAMLDLTKSASSTIDAINERTGDLTKNDIESMAHAIAKMSKADEAKIVNAVVEHQNKKTHGDNVIHI